MRGRRGAKPSISDWGGRVREGRGKDMGEMMGVVVCGGLRFLALLLLPLPLLRG